MPSGISPRPSTFQVTIKPNRYIVDVSRAFRMRNRFMMNIPFWIRYNDIPWRISQYIMWMWQILNGHSEWYPCFKEKKKQVEKEKIRGQWSFINQKNKQGILFRMPKEDLCLVWFCWGFSYAPLMNVNLMKLNFRYSHYDFEVGR